MADPRGPLKPPVIDLEARPATGGKQPGPDAAGKKPDSESAKETGPTPDKAGPEPAPAREPSPARRASPILPALTGAIGGGALGLGLAWALATAGYWPTPPVPEPDLAPVESRLTGLADALSAEAGRLDALEARLSARNDTVSGELAARNATIDRLEQEMAALSTRTSDLAATLADTTPEPVDLSGITGDISGLRTALATLGNRVDALASGASSEDAAALADNIATIEDRIDALATRLAEIEEAPAPADALAPELDGLQTELGGLAARMSDIEAAAAAAQASLTDIDTRLMDLAARPAPEPQRLAGLALALSGLEAAFDTGRPFARELAVVTAALPGLAVPPLVNSAADTGLPTAAATSAALARLTPQILAARPAPADGDWAAIAIDRAQALLAIRPAGEAPGDAPEAVFARLEAAVARDDFASAHMLLGLLPAPMQAATAEAGDMIAARAAAEALVTEARTLALAAGEVPA